MRWEKIKVKNLKILENLNVIEICFFCKYPDNLFEYLAWNVKKTPEVRLSIKLQQNNEW